MPRFKLRPWRSPRLSIQTSLGVSGTLTVNLQQSNIPSWYGAPVITGVAGQTSAWQDIPVYAGGDSITLGWHSSNNPAFLPNWVEFQHGPNPKIRLLSNVQDSNDVSPFVLMATANGQTVLSANGQGSITVSAQPVQDTGTITSLTLYPAQTGTYPYLATVYPLESQLVEGYTFGSDDDALLRSTVLSRWPDNSAQVVVLAGETAFPTTASKTIHLKAVSTAELPLTTARISTLVTNIAVNIPTVGSYNGPLPAPLQTWWANERVICASYRLPIASGMSAIAYIHAFSSNRALVEVTVGNGEVNATLSPPVAPSPKSYTGASVVVNGNITLASGVSSPPAGQSLNGRFAGTWAGGHEPGRAWYCKGWVGGDPQVEVTHDPAYIQQHPWYWKVIETPTVDMQARYSGGYDTYTPWSVGRLRVPEFNAGGDDEQIAMLPDEQAMYMATGNIHARRAVLATGLAMLSMAFNWRHTDGKIPTYSQHYGKACGPGTDNSWVVNETQPCWGKGISQSYFDSSHVPATTLTAFLCHPSPVFIEIAQAEGVWEHSCNNTEGLGAHWREMIRGRAWKLRNYAIAAFLTPDGNPAGTPEQQEDATRKANWRTILEYTADYYQQFFDKSWNNLGIIWKHDPNWIENGEGDHNPSTNEYGTATFQQYFCVMAWNAVDRVKLVRNAGENKMTKIARKISEHTVRLVNEAIDGSWRCQHIGVGVGMYVAGPPAYIDYEADWGAVYRNYWTTAATFPKAGPFLNVEDNYATVLGDEGKGYEAIFFTAFASAVERGDVTGADQAWQYVYTDNGLDNFQAWRQHFKNYTARYNRFPRNKVDTKVQPAATTLSTAATNLASNGWVSFTGSNINTLSNHPVTGEQVHWFDDGRKNLGYQMFGYTGRGCYDPATRQVLWMGTGASDQWPNGGNYAPGSYVLNTRPVYAESSNQWRTDRAFRGSNEGTTTSAINHICDSNCLGNGKLYKHTSYDGILVYNVGSNTMEATIDSVSDKDSSHWWPAMTFVPNRGTQGALWLWYPGGGEYRLSEFLIGGSSWSVIKTFAISHDPAYDFNVMSYNPRAFNDAGGVMLGHSQAMFVLTTPNSGAPVSTQISTSPLPGPVQFGWYNSGFCHDPNGNGWIYVCNETLRVYQAAQSGGTYTWTDRGAIPSELMSNGSVNFYQFIVVPIDRNNFDMYGAVWVISYGAQGNWGSSGWSPSAYLYKPPRT